MKNSFWHYSCE